MTIERGLHTSRRLLTAMSASLALSMLPGCQTTPERVESVISVNNTKDRLKELIEKTKVNYNGKEHNFPNDAIIDGPNENGIYTISSNKLKKVTKDVFQFDRSFNLLTKQIIINIDSFDFLTATIMQARFGIKDGDICSVNYENGVLRIQKI